MFANDPFGMRGPRAAPLPERYSAAICRRGHWATTILEGHASVDPRCTKCGAPVITNCPNCQARLLGAHPGVISSGSKPDKFCSQCGSPFPWADRTDLILQLRNQLEFEPGLDNADRLELIEQIAVLSGPEQDGKKRVRAGERVKQLAPKGWAVAQPILQTLLTAELRKQLGLPPI